MDTSDTGGLVVESSFISVTLSRDVPAIECIRLSEGGTGLRAPRIEPRIALYDTAADTLLICGTQGVSSRYRLETARPGAAAFAVTVERHGVPVVAFVLSYTVRDHRIEAGFSEVSESDTAQLAWIEMRSLLRITARTGAARLAIPTHGGRIVDPATCASGERYHRYSWVEDSFNQVGAAYDGSMLALLRIGSLDDQMYSYVDSASSPPCAGLGVRFTRRYTRADRPYSGRHGDARGVEVVRAGNLSSAK